MKEEKIYLGIEDYSFSLVLWSQKVGRINNRIVPTLTALGLCDKVDVIIDVAAKGREYLKEIYKKRFLEMHPAMIHEEMESYAECEVERIINATCKDFKFTPVAKSEFSDEEAQYLKKVAIFENGLLSIDDERLKKRHEIYATGENAKLYREIENALKVINKAFRKHLDKSTFNALFYWGEDKQLHFKNCISLKVLDEIRGVKK